MSSDTSYLSHGGGNFFAPRAKPLEPAAASRVWSKADLEARLPGLLRLADWFGVAALGLVVDALFASHGAGSLTHALAIILGATATVNFLHLAHAYSLHSIARPAAQLTKMTIAWCGSYLSLVAISSVLRQADEFSGTWTILWLASALVCLAATKCAVGRRLQRWKREGRSARNVAVLGTGREAFALAQRLSEGREEARVVGVFVDADIRLGPANVAGDVEQLASLARAGKVDEVVVCLPWRSERALNGTLSKFAACQVEVRIDPGIPDIDYPLTEFSHIAGIPTLKVQCRPLSGWGAPLKRLEDLVLASTLIVVLSPALLAIGLLIKIDSRGPVVFRQERYGLNNQRIQVLKFRTMHHDPNPDPNVPQARRNDPRVTRIGRFLRRTSLDELLQLLNVLRGEMSLVGPRPHASAHNEQYARLIEGYLGRHRMKPGITGWAQVNGLRGAVQSVDDMRCRLQYDRYYMANWSVLLDIKVLLMTVPALFRGTNAY